MSMLIDAYRFGSGGGGAYPTRLSTSSQQFTAATTNHDVSMPATVNAGDLLLVTISINGVSALTTPSGWALIANSEAANATAVRMASYYKVAAGTEGGTTVNFASASAARAVSTVRRYQAGTYSGTPEASVTTNVTATPDPPTLSPSWGLAKCDWNAFACIHQGTSVSAYPYATDQTFQNSGATGTVHVSQASCSSPIDAGSENPGTFSISGGSVRNWVASTVAIRGT